MMQYSEFEKHARQTLSFDVEDVNIEALLGSLSLGTKPKRKFPFLWIGVALLGLLCTVGICSYLQRSTSSLDKSNDGVNAMSIGFAADENASAANGSGKSNNNATLLINNEDNTSTSNSPDGTLAINTSDEENSESTTNSSSTSTFISNQNEKATNTPSSTNEQAKTRSNKPSYSPGQNRESKVKNKAPYSIEKAFVPETVINTKVALSTDVASIQNKNTNVSALSNKTLNRFVRSTEIASSLSHLDLQAFDIAKRDIDMGDPIKCPTFKEGSRFHFDIIPEIGYMVPDKTLSDENTETSLVTSLRKDKERSLEGLQAALYGRVTMDDSPFYLKAGLSYTRLSEQLPLEYDYIESDTTIGIVSTSTNAAGDTITVVMGEIITDTQFTGNTTKHYFLHQWDLPIAIGYERPMGGFMLGIEGGLNINLRTSVSGNILETQDLFKPAERGTDISRRVGLGFFGGVSIGKYISGIGDVYLAARARYIPDVSADAAQTSQSYMVYGLHAGYVYRF